MRSRGLVVAIAVVLAVAAAAAVILYTQGVKQDVEQGSNLTAVIVPTVDIRANQPLDPLLAQDIFKQVRVPGDALVQNAVTDVSDLRGQSTTAPIFANEQIPLARISSGEVAPGGALGISEGHVAVAVELEAPQGGTGNIQVGDNVSVFATYQDTQVLVGVTNQQLVNGNIPGDIQQKKLDAPDFTVTLIPTVRVIRIQNPEVDSETGQQNDSDQIRITLDLEPQDAQNLVFAQENARVWLGLLPPDEEGTQPDASTVPLELLLGAKLG
jgi:Flp pilus assembly protein CpaB